MNEEEYQQAIRCDRRITLIHPKTGISQMACYDAEAKTARFADGTVLENIEPNDDTTED